MKEIASGGSETEGEWETVVLNKTVSLQILKYLEWLFW